MNSTLFETRTATPWLRQHLGQYGINFSSLSVPGYKHVYRTLGEYVDYATRINHGPLWTHLCCGIGLIGGSINPNLRIHDGGRQIDSRMYMAIVGPSGSGKSTMIEIAKRVFTSHPALALYRTSTPTSPQGFIKHFLAPSGREERAFIIDSDWTGWLQEAKTGTTRQMKPALLKFYDREGHDYSSLGAGSCIASDPKISMLVGVPTPAWQENFTEGDITGGLLSRFTVHYQTKEDMLISKGRAGRVQIDPGVEVAIARRLINLHRARGNVYVPAELEEMHSAFLKRAENARYDAKLTRRAEAGAVRMSITYLKMINMLAVDRVTANIEVPGDQENIAPIDLGAIPANSMDLTLAFALAQIFTDSAILAIHSVGTSGEEVYMQRVRDAVEKFAAKDVDGTRTGGTFVPLSLLLSEALFPDRTNPINVLKTMVELTQELRCEPKTIGGITEKAYAFTKDFLAANALGQSLPVQPSEIQKMSLHAQELRNIHNDAWTASNTPQPSAADSRDPLPNETIPMVNKTGTSWQSPQAPPAPQPAYSGGGMMLGPDGFPIDDDEPGYY